MVLLILWVLSVLTIGRNVTFQAEVRKNKGVIGSHPRSQRPWVLSVLQLRALAGEVISERGVSTACTQASSVPEQ